ncbi:MAG: hypothetical protein RLZZ548_1371, partial [Bacteroidota bacterium]
MSKYLVIIPTYNEIENIERMVHTVMALEKDIELLVVDDNSPDGTANQVDAMMSQYNTQRTKLHILKRQGKNG